MALVKTIIKSNPREVVLKWTGSGTDTVTLASLVSGAQTVTGTPFVSILAVTVSQSASGVTKVTRNNQDVLNMTGRFQYQFENAINTVMDENGGSDIAINVLSDATLILSISKKSGYSGI